MVICIVGRFSVNMESSSRKNGGRVDVALVSAGSMYQAFLFSRF